MALAIIKKPGWNLDKKVQQDPSLALGYQCLSDYATFANQNLVANYANLPYLKARKLSLNDIVNCKLGYLGKTGQKTPFFEQFLATYSAKGYTLDLLEQVGLIKGEKIAEKTNQKTYFDLFSDRLLFPLVNGFNQLSGFSARKLKPDEPHVVKYVNSSNSPYFNKTNSLFNPLLKPLKDPVVITEGAFDAISGIKGGFNSSIALNGLNLTPAHINFLKNQGIKQVLLALDNDRAGINATHKLVAQLTNAHFDIKLIDPKVVKKVGCKDLGESFEQADEKTINSLLNSSISYPEWVMKMTSPCKNGFVDWTNHEPNNQYYQYANILSAFSVLPANQVHNWKQWMIKNTNFSEQQLDDLLSKYYEALKPNYFPKINLSTKQLIKAIDKTLWTNDNWKSVLLPILGEYTQKSAGYFFHSPFNPSDHSPSFCINPIKGIWKDFSSSMKGGSLATLLTYLSPDAKAFTSTPTLGYSAVVSILKNHFGLAVDTSDLALNEATAYAPLVGHQKHEKVNENDYCDELLPLIQLHQNLFTVMQKGEKMSDESLKNSLPNMNVHAPFIPLVMSGAEPLLGLELKQSLSNSQTYSALLSSLSGNENTILPLASLDGHLHGVVVNDHLLAPLHPFGYFDVEPKACFAHLTSDVNKIGTEKNICYAPLLPKALAQNLNNPLLKVVNISVDENQVETIKNLIKTNDQLVFINGSLFTQAKNIVPHHKTK